MCKRTLRLLVSLCIFTTFMYAQDEAHVLLDLSEDDNGYELLYDTTVSGEDIYGFQFNVSAFSDLLDNADVPCSFASAFGGDAGKSHGQFRDPLEHGVEAFPGQGANGDPGQGLG